MNMKSLVSALAAVAAIGLQAATTYTATEQYVQNVVKAESNRTDLAIGALRQEVQDAKYLTPSAIKAGANISVTTNAAGEVTIAADGGVEVDFTTNNTVLVTTIETVAPAPADYATVSNKAMNAVTKTGNSVISGDLSANNLYAQTDASNRVKISPTGISKQNGEEGYDYSLPDKSGTVALDSDISAVSNNVLNIADERYVSVGGGSDIAGNLSVNGKLTITEGILVMTNGVANIEQTAIGVNLKRLEHGRDVDYSWYWPGAVDPTNANYGATLVTYSDVTNATTLTPVYSDTPTFSEWTFSSQPSTQGFFYLSVYDEMLGTWSLYESYATTTTFVARADHDYGFYSLQLGFEVNGGTVTATRTRTDISGYILGDQNNYVLAATNAIENSIGIVDVTWENLTNLIGKSELVPGQQYAITNYTTTTSVSGTVASGHDFDIIVTADSQTTLNRNARARSKISDSYFLPDKVSAWEIKYDIDNETNKYEWATVSGKGVVYYLKDENENEAPYDFKNIKFGNSYTFDTSTGEDASLTNTVCCKIGVLIDELTNKRKLNNIILIGKYRNVIVEDGCSYIKMQATGVSPGYVQNINILSGVNGTSESWKSIDTTDRSQEYHTTYKPSESVEISL